MQRQDRSDSSETGVGRGIVRDTVEKAVLSLGFPWQGPGSDLERTVCGESAMVA